MKFILGLDAHSKVVGLAQALPESAWQPLARVPKYTILTEPRAKGFRHKEQIVIERGSENQKRMGESVAELEYRPAQCQSSYRLVILRENISVQRGEQALLEAVPYFFHLTNRRGLKLPQVVGLANGRCNQENVIAQLQNGVNAMRLPVRDLVSNWA